MTKLVVVDFTATWCGPCQQIAPRFEELSKEHNPDIEFVKVDVDDVNDIAARQNIKAMPTFQFFRNGDKIDELQGANVPHLKEKLEKYK